MTQKYFKISPDHRNNLISSKLFRTSTQYLIEPPPIDSHESTALSPMVMSNHTPYFAIGSEDGYSYENSKPLGKQKIPQIKYNKKVEKEDQKYEKKEKRKSRSPDKLKKVENIIKSVAIQHSRLKLKLQMAKNQKKEKEVVALSPRGKMNLSLAITPKNKTWTPPVSPKFNITGNMTERYNKSLLLKASTILEDKLAKEREEMRECTFSPKFVSKDITDKILAKKELERLKKEEQQYAFEPQKDDSVFIKIKRKEKLSYFKKPTRFQFEQFKGLIKNQLERVNLQRLQQKKSPPKEPQQSPPKRASP